MGMLTDITGVFKGKERKTLTAQIQLVEKEISEKLDAFSEILKYEGYPDWKFRPAKSIVPIKR